MRAIVILATIGGAIVLVGTSGSAQQTGAAAQSSGTVQSGPAQSAPFPMRLMAASNTGLVDPARSYAFELLSRSDVQDDLKIDGRQREALQAIDRQSQQDVMTQYRERAQALRNMTPEERRAAFQQGRLQRMQLMQSYWTDRVKKAETILRPEQVKRLHELDLQWRGAMALVDRDVAQKVGITPQQQTQIFRIVQEYRNTEVTAMRGVWTGMRFARPGSSQPAPPAPPQPPNAQTMQDRLTAARAAVDKARKANGDQVLALLSPEQRQTWRTLEGRLLTFRLYQ